MADDAGYPTPSIQSDPRQPADPAKLERVRKMFSEAQTLTAAARTQSATDEDYYHHEQWTPTEREELKKRNQPDIVINRVQVAINGITGVSERGRSEPRAYPRTPKDEGSADVATDVLRFIADQNRFHRLKQDCFFDKLVPGTMAVLIGVNEQTDVELSQIRFEEFFWDPRSRRKDFKDARYMGIARWLYADDVTLMYPDYTKDIEGCVSTGAGQADALFQDRPDGVANVWADKIQRRLLVVEIYYREAGTWMRCVFIGAVMLESGPSPYLDDRGRPENPIEAQSAYVNRKNERYGAVRGMRGPQDEVNKRRSKLLYLNSVNQVEAANADAVHENAEMVREEAARPDGVLPFGWRKVSTADMSAGQAALLNEAKAEIERMGPNPAVLGRQGEDQSGRALLARQQAGLVELANLYGGLEDWELRVYRQCWGRAKQYWKAPRFIRVTDNEDAPKFVGLNGATSQAPAAPQLPGVAQVAGGQPQQQQSTQNNLGEMDVDIILETTPDTGTLAQEQFGMLAQLLTANPTWANEFGFEAMVDLSSIPRKRQILEKMKARHEQPNPANEIAAAAAKAALAKTASEAQLNEARAKAAIGQALRAGTGAQLDQAKTQTELAKPHLEAVQMYQDAILHPAVTPPPGDPSQGAGAPESLPPQ